MKIAKVLIVGAGGLGCPAVVGCLAAGVGTVTIIDDDVVELSNLARQFVYSHEHVGCAKSLTLAELLSKQYPFSNVQGERVRFGFQLESTHYDNYDIIIDCSDNLDTRYAIDQFCVQSEKPWIHASLYQNKALLSIFWSRTGSSYKSLFTSESNAEVKGCDELGVTAPHAITVGSIQAMLAVQLIIGDPSLDTSRLIHLNLSKAQTEHFQLPSAIDLEPYDTNKLNFCAIELSAAETIAATSEKLHILAIDTDDELNLGRFQSEHIAEDACGAKIQSLNQDEPILLFCTTGLISRFVAEAYQSRGWLIYCLKQTVAHS